MGLRLWLGRIALSVWFAFVLIIGAGLLARHLVPLPAPPGDPRFVSAMNRLRSQEGTWLAVHVLYAECRCSHRIASHLAKTKRPRGWEEVILWVGSTEPRAGLSQHFRLERLTRRDLSAFGVEAAPLLVALDPEGHVRYSGGYTERKQGPVVDDLRILSESERSARVMSLPVLGCAVSERLERVLARLPSI